MGIIFCVIVIVYCRVCCLLLRLELGGLYISQNAGFSVKPVGLPYFVLLKIFNNSARILHL